MKKKRVIIVGGGFAGLKAAKELRDVDVDITLIDSRNHHLFQPLLYQVATAGLSPSDIAVPIRSQFYDQKNISVHLDNVEQVDLNRKLILTSNEGKLDFDYLILACGARHSYFGNPEWEKYAPGLKSLEEAIDIRKRILLAFEQAENSIDPTRNELNFVVVGGGATGVELAGAIADISRTVLVRDFKRIDPSTANVYLIQAIDRVLPQFDEELSQKSKHDLETLGVNVLLNSTVTKITEEGVFIGEKFIASKSVFWAAGVLANPMKFSPEVSKDRNGRVYINEDLSIQGNPNVFVLGDMANFRISDGVTLPGLAPVAIQQGQHAVYNIKRDLSCKKRSPFVYTDKGQMATIGKSKAVLEFKSIKVDGFLAWLAWIFVHIFYLIGFRNRVLVLCNWIWSYLFSKRGARLITNHTETKNESNSKNN